MCCSFPLGVRGGGGDHTQQLALASFYNISGVLFLPFCGVFSDVFPLFLGVWERAGGGVGSSQPRRYSYSILYPVLHQSPTLSNSTHPISSHLIPSHPIPSGLPVRRHTPLHCHPQRVLLFDLRFVVVLVVIVIGVLGHGLSPPPLLLSSNLSYVVGVRRAGDSPCLQHHAHSSGRHFGGVAAQAEGEARSSVVAVPGARDRQELSG